MEVNFRFVCPRRNYFNIYALSFLFLIDAIKGLQMKGFETVLNCKKTLKPKKGVFYHKIILCIKHRNLTMLHTLR